MDLNRLMGLISGIVNDKDNPLGLTRTKVDEIKNAIKLIKGLISDGIQKGDISKLVGLLGEIAEAIPELGQEIHHIIKCLKKLSKILFGDDPKIQGKENSFSNKMKTQMMQMIMDFKQMVNPNELIDPIDLDSNIQDQFHHLLKHTREEREKLGIHVLEMINDKVILSRESFDMLEKGVSKIGRLAEIQPTDNKVNPIDDPQNIPPMDNSNQIV